MLQSQTTQKNETQLMSNTLVLRVLQCFTYQTQGVNMQPLSLDLILMNTQIHHQCSDQQD